MQGFIGVMRIVAKHAAILLVLGAVLQFASAHTPGEAGAQRSLSFAGDRHAPLRITQGAARRARITGIDHVRLYVSDIEKSRAFYTAILGPRFSGGSCSGGTLPCFPINWRQQIELQTAPPVAPKNWVAEIGFATDDVSQLRAYLVANGIVASKVSNDLSDYDKHPVNAHFEVLDPEGNLISFVQRFGASINDFLPVVRILHAGFVVKDTAVENRFYRDLLGFKLYWYGGFKDNGVDWYEIQVPDGPDWIEYMLNIPANADKKELGVQDHFSLGTRDAKEAAALLRNNGVLKIDGPEIGRDGKNALDIYDPDGTRVEVMEFTPTKEPCCHPYTAPHPTP
jgi:catechol 2,3-dioxygenase-like lactoylglutathione lyase family enzyme